MQIRPAYSLDRSGTACFFSIKSLIETYAHCYLWTWTLPYLESDSYIAACRCRLFTAANHLVRSGNLPAFAGTRVTEVHPGGHGLHDHAVMTFGHALERRKGADAIWRRLAKEAGYGICHRDSIEAGVASSIYLSSYLTKNDGFRLSPGMRRWQNFGVWSQKGVKVRDIVYEGEEIEVFTRVFRDAVAKGIHPWQAFKHARREQWEWRAFAK